MITEEELLQKKGAVFFTEQASLKSWDEAGILSREVGFYNELSRHLAKIYLLTYGHQEDLKYRERLAANIEVLPILSDVGEDGNRQLLNDVLGDADFLRTHQVRGSEIALYCKKKSGLPLFVRSGYIWSLHYRRESRNPLASWLVQRKEKRIFRECDAILCTSEAGVSHARRLCSSGVKPIGLIPNYVDTERFRPFSVPKKRKSVIFVGRLTRQKNPLGLLKAVENIPCSVTIVGDGPLRNQILSFAQEKGINLGYRQRVFNEDLPSLLNQHSIFVLPSLFEGLPKVLLEAMACGLAVVGSRIDGIRDLIEDGINGLMCSPNPGSIREVLKILLGDPSLIQRYGEKARMKIQEKFNVHQVAKQEIAFLQRNFYLFLSK